MVNLKNSPLQPDQGDGGRVSHLMLLTVYFVRDNFLQRLEVLTVSRILLLYFLKEQKLYILCIIHVVESESFCLYHKHLSITLHSIIELYTFHEIHLPL